MDGQIGCPIVMPFTLIRVEEYDFLCQNLDFTSPEKEEICKEWLNNHWEIDRTNNLAGFNPNIEIDTAHMHLVTEFRKMTIHLDKTETKSVCVLSLDFDGFIAKYSQNP